MVARHLPVKLLFCGLLYPQLTHGFRILGAFAVVCSLTETRFIRQSRSPHQVPQIAVVEAVVVEQRPFSGRRRSLNQRRTTFYSQHKYSNIAVYKSSFKMSTLAFFKVTVQPAAFVGLAPTELTPFFIEIHRENKHS